MNDVSVIRADLQALIPSGRGVNPSNQEKGDIAGGIVRLAFHDAGTFSVADGTGGADGCLDLSDADNGGLQAVVDQLEPVYTKHQQTISK